MLRAGYPTYSLGEGGTICPGSRPAGVTTGCPRIVTECLLTRSMLIKWIHLPFQGMCLYMYFVFTVSQFHADVHSVYIVYSFDTTVLPESMRMSNMFWYDLKSPYSLLICSISACSQHQYLLPWLFFVCISFDLHKERTKERKNKNRSSVIESDLLRQNIES